MSIKKWAVLLLGAAILLPILAGCTRHTDKVRIGTGGIGGTYAACGAALGEIFGAVFPEVPFEVKHTAGSAANLRLMSDQYLELAITQSDVADDAYHGTGVFRDKAYTGYSAVASLYTEACQIVVRADSSIRTIDDLLGKKISVGEEGSGVLYHAESILECCGLPFDAVERCNLSYADAAKALYEGTIDAFFCTAGAPTTAVAALAEKMPVRLLGLDDHQMERLLATHQSYIPVLVPANTYPGQEQEVKTVGVRAILVAGNQLSQEEVYAFLSALNRNSKMIEKAAGAKWNFSQITAGITIPYHPGAIQFFEEHDIVITGG